MGGEVEEVAEKSGRGSSVSYKISLPVRGAVVRLCLILVLAVILLPLFLLVSYSFMGVQELRELCGPVLSGLEGMSGFRLDPGLPHTACICAAPAGISPEFFTAFWNSCIQTGGILAGQLLTAVPAAWAFARFRFSGKRVAVVSLYAFDGSSLSGNYGIRLSGAECGTSDGYAGSSEFCRECFPLCRYSYCERVFPPYQGKW